MIRDDLFAQPAQPAERVQLATVTDADSSGVYLLLDGESEAGTTAYRYLSGYTPAPGDRVLFQRVGGTLLVIGKVM